jgi:hypothetical protein
MQAKTLLAVFAIVIAVGFVAANSVIPQASAQQFCVGKNGEVFNGMCPPGHNGPSLSAQSTAPGHLSTGGPGTPSTAYAPGHSK